MKVQQVLDWINGFAPFDSAESFDNVGLLMGDREADVHTVLFGLDVTEALVKEAVHLGADLIVAHHPFIFRGIKRIDYTGPQGRILAMILQHGISVVAAHTNYDKAPGGVSESLAVSLGLSNVECCDPYVRIGTLPSPLFPEELTTHIHKSLRSQPRCYYSSARPISRVAVAGGAYGEGYEAALSAGADAYVVGEIGYHDVSEAVSRGLVIYDAGHFPTELPGIANLYLRFLADASASEWNVQAHLYQFPPFAGVLSALP